MCILSVHLDILKQLFVFYINSYRVKDYSDLKALTGETVESGKSSERASQNEVYCVARNSVIDLVPL